MLKSYDIKFEHLYYITCSKSNILIYPILKYVFLTFTNRSLCIYFNEYTAELYD